MTGYRLYRDGVLIASPFSTSFSNTTVVAGTTYSYSVAAVDMAGNISPQSAHVSVTTLVATPTISIGARVHTTTGGVNVRNKPNANSGKVLCQQPTNSLGTVVGGPTSAQGYTWWNVNFDTACDGWVAETYISL